MSCYLLIICIPLLILDVVDTKHVPGYTVGFNCIYIFASVLICYSLIPILLYKYKEKKSKQSNIVISVLNESNTNMSEIKTDDTV